MAGPIDSKLVVIGWILLDFSPKPEGPLAPVQSKSCSNSLYNSIIQGQLWQTETAYSEAETLLCQQRSLESKLCFFPVVMYGCESWTVKEAEPPELMLSNCGTGEDS